MGYDGYQDPEIMPAKTHLFYNTLKYYNNYGIYYKLLTHNSLYDTLQN